MDVSSKEMAVVASGIINGLGSIGPVIQELVIGYLKTEHGPESVFILLVVMAAIAVVEPGFVDVLPTPSLGALKEAVRTPSDIVFGPKNNDNDSPTRGRLWRFMR